MSMPVTSYDSKDRSSLERTMESAVRRLIGAGIATKARFLTSLRVGSGTHTSFDGQSGAIVADGANAALITYDVVGGNNWVRLNRNATQFFISTAEGAADTFDVTSGNAVQAALTTLVAGTNITLGVTGFTTQGTRLVVPTGMVYAQINLTATGVIGAGSVVATTASGHRPPSTIAIAATKFTGGALGSPVPTVLLINAAGQVVNEVALANTDTLAATVIFMTV